MKSSHWMTFCVLTALMSAGPAAQEKPAPPPARPPAGDQPRESSALVPLKVTVVLSRHKGDKRLSSLPYVLGVTANSAKPTTLRLGVQVPVTMTVFGGPAGDGKSVPSTSYSYRNVGTNIDCQANALPGGVFQLMLTVEDSSIHLDPAQKPEAATPTKSDVPSFRSFNSSFTILLKDGQTTQHTSATDPVSGEVMRIDVTLNVMK
jgi:hypothetical protein